MNVDRRLTHVELLHAPGERALAARVFELLGCTVSDSGRHWFTAFIDTNLRDYANNAFYASEAPAEQIAIEAAMADSVDEWVEMVRAAPQNTLVSEWERLKNTEPSSTTSVMPQRTTLSCAVVLKCSDSFRTMHLMPSPRTWIKHSSGRT